MGCRVRLSWLCHLILFAVVVTVVVHLSELQFPFYLLKKGNNITKNSQNANFIWLEQLKYSSVFHVTGSPEIEWASGLVNSVTQ